MSGIAGYWNRDGEPANSEILAFMGETLKHRGPDGCGEKLSGDFALQAQMMFNTPESVGEIQPLLDSKTGTLLVFDGRLDNREEFEGSATASDAKLALDAYMVEGLSFASRLKGDYAFVLFEPSKKQLVLGRDPVGVRPLYYTSQKNLFAFGSEIKAIMAHPSVKTAPDKSILAEWLLNFAYDRERTFFENILAVEPGHLVIVRPDKIETQEFWDFDPSKKTKLKTFADACEAYRFHLEQAVRRQMRSAYPVALSVSGGMDSSSIYCLADGLLKKEPLCPRFEAFSWQLRDGRAHDEYAYVESLEGPGKPTIHPVPMVSVGPYKNVERAVWMNEHPLLDTHWGNYHNIMKAASDRGARTFMTGLWSDQFFNRQGYLVDLLWQGRWRAIRNDFKSYVHWMVDVDPNWKFRELRTQLLRYHIPQGLKPMLRPFWKNRQYDDWYAEEFKALGRQRWQERHRPRKKSATCHARDMYEAARTGYMPMILECDNKQKAYYGMDSVTPFLDRDLLQFNMSIPGDWMNWQGIPKGILRESMRGVLPEKIRARRGKAHFTFVGNDAIDRDYYAIIDKLMSGREIEKQGLVDLEKFAYAKPQLRDGLHTDSSFAAWALTNALGVEMLFQIFFTQKKEKEVYL